MFRRVLSLFCLPCAQRDTGLDEFRLVCVADDDDAPFNPKEVNVVRVQYRWAPGQQEAAQMPAREQKMSLTSPAADSVIVEWCPSGLDTPQKECITETESAAPDDGKLTGGAGPAPSRRRRGCRRCWAERLGQKVVVPPHCREGYRLAPRYV